MADWPFQLAKPGGYSDDDPITPAEATQMDLNASRAADGRVWTDVAAVSNLPHRFTNTLGGAAIIYNPTLDEIFSFATPSGDVTGFRSRRPFNVQTSLSIPTGTGLILNPNYQVAAADDAGNMVVGGACGISGQAHIRYSADGTTWTSANTFQPATTNAPNYCFYAGDPINAFFMLWPTGEIEQSVDGGATWTDRTTTNYIYIMGTYSPTLGRAAFIGSTGSAGRIVFTDDNSSDMTPSALATPEDFVGIFWSENLQLFIATANAPGTFYTTPDITSGWTQLTGVHPCGGGTGVGLPCFFFEVGRALGCYAGGTLGITVDGGASWIDAGLPYMFGGVAFDSSHDQLFLGHRASVTPDVPDGLHLASLRLGT
jgi:hypothetical protein